MMAWFQRLVAKTKSFLGKTFSTPRTKKGEMQEDQSNPSQDGSPLARSTVGCPQSNYTLSTRKEKSQPTPSLKPPQSMTASEDSFQGVPSNMMKRPENLSGTFQTQSDQQSTLHSTYHRTKRFLKTLRLLFKTIIVRQLHCTTMPEQNLKSAEDLKSQAGRSGRSTSKPSAKKSAATVDLSSLAGNWQKKSKNTTKRLLGKEPKTRESNGLLKLSRSREFQQPNKTEEMGNIAPQGQNPDSPLLKEEAAQKGNGASAQEQIKSPANNPSTRRETQEVLASVAKNGQMGTKYGEVRTVPEIHQTAQLNEESKVYLTLHTGQPGSNRRITQQEGVATDKTGYLQEPFSCDPASNKEATYTGLSSDKSVPHTASFQDGEFEDAIANYQRRRVYGQSGYPRCLPERAHAPQEHEVLGTADRKEHLPIHISMLRPQHRPASVHSNHESGIEAIAQERIENSGLPRRPTHTRRYSGTGEGFWRDGSQTPRDFGISYQLKEDRLGTQTNQRVFGDDCLYQDYANTYSRRETEKDSSRSESKAISRSLDNEEMVFNDWTDTFSVERNADRTTDVQSDAQRFEISHGQKPRLEAGCSSGGIRRLPAGASMVEQGGLALQRKAPTPAYTQANLDNRCLEHRMGSSSGGPHVSRQMGGPGDGTYLESDRSIGYTESAPNSKTRTEWEHNQNTLRQHGNGSEHCKARRHTFVSVPEHNNANLETVGGFKDRNPSAAHCWEIQQQSRQSESSFPEPQRRVQSAGGDDGLDQAGVRGPDGRSFRHREKSSDKGLLFEVPRERGDGYRQFQTPVERSGTHLSKPADNPDNQGLQEVSSRSMSSNDTHHSRVGDDPVHGGNQETDRTKHPTDPEGLHIRPRGQDKFQGLQSDRSTYIKARMNADYPDLIKERLAQSLAPSTNKTYQVAWGQYVKFCESLKKIPEDPTSLVSFISYLYDLDYNADTIRSKAVAISSTVGTLRSTGVTLGQTEDVVKMLDFVQKNGIRTQKTNMMWDLGEALTLLKRINETDEEFLLAKAAFLVALTASWRPASDLERLAADQVIFNSTSKCMYLTSRGVKEGRDKFTVIYEFEDRELCPVTALRSYMEMTKTAEGRTQENAVFVYPRTGERMKGERISKSISLLMHGMLKIPATYKTRSIRGTSASTLLSSGMSVSLILERANWASHATFLKFYKKDFIDAGEVVTNIIQNKVAVANSRGTSIESSSDSIRSSRGATATLGPSIPPLNPLANTRARKSAE